MSIELGPMLLLSSQLSPLFSASLSTAATTKAAGMVKTAEGILHFIFGGRNP